MKNLIKTTAVSVIVTVTLMTSGLVQAKMSDNTARGMGVLLSFHQQCEDFSQSGAEQFINMISAEGETSLTLAVRTKFRAGMKQVEDMTCKDARTMVKSTGAYDIFFQ